MNQNGRLCCSFTIPCVDGLELSKSTSSTAINTTASSIASKITTDHLTIQQQFSDAYSHLLNGFGLKPFIQKFIGRDSNNPATENDIDIVDDNDKEEDDYIQSNNFSLNVDKNNNIHQTKIVLEESKSSNDDDDDDDDGSHERKLLHLDKPGLKNYHKTAIPSNSIDDIDWSHEMASAK